MVVVHPPNPFKRFTPPTRQAIIATSVVVAIALGGTAGWLVLKRDQQAKLRQAQTLLTTACRSNFTANPAALEAAQTKANQATQLLTRIPRLPGIGEPAAQTQRASFAQCFQDLQATQNFFKAQTLSTDAFKITGATVLPVADWRSLQANLQQSIAFLQSIPDQTVIYPQAQAALTEHQAQLAAVQSRMQYEQAAVDALAQAQTLKQQVDRILQSAPDTNQLAEAETKLQQAIDWLQTIPVGHTVSQPSQTLLGQYQDQLVRVQYQHAISHLQPLLKEFQTFAQFTDALDIRSEEEFHAYFDRIHALQNQFDALVQPSEPLRLHPATKNLEAVLTEYHDASALWHQCHAEQCYNSWTAGMVINTRDATIDFRSAWWLPATYQVEGDVEPLATKYGLTTATNWTGRKFIQVNTAIVTMWQQAEQNIQTAEQQLQSNSVE